MEEVGKPIDGVAYAFSSVLIGLAGKCDDCTFVALGGCHSKFSLTEVLWS